MKRIIALVLTMIAVVGLAACGESKSSEDKSKKPAGGHTQSTVVSSNDTTASKQQTSNELSSDSGFDFGLESANEFPADVFEDELASDVTPSMTASNDVTSKNNPPASQGTSSKDSTSKNNTDSKDNITSNNTASKDTASNETSSKNPTTSQATPSNGTESSLTSSVVTEFFNVGNPKITLGKLTIHPRHVYWKDGELVAQCFIVNGTGESLTGVRVNRLVFTNGKGEVLVDGSFSSTIGFVSAIGRKLNHGENIVWNFTFSGDSVINYGADLSRIIIDASTNNYR